MAECGRQARHDDPARQTRAMWITTVRNGDWPSRPGLPVARQKAEFRRLLDVAVRLNLNAVYVQVRPTADAFYRSAYEPWSEYLTGSQGRDPGYDPLKFMVDEAHARGLEFHAWFNPYRVSAQADPKHLVAGSPPRKHPDWVHRYGGALWYDPGVPQVRELIDHVVLDVVNRYDIDGVHLDDYFYPYPLPGRPFPDQATFKKYGAGSKNVGDWRRHNVDMLIKDLDGRIHQARRWVKFGVSPFGVWRNRSSDPRGSDTKALQSYDDIYADTRGWVKHGWVDYVAPQLYWPIGFKAADYRTLVAWWAGQVSGTPVQLIIGQAAYQVGKAPGWDDPRELSRHVAVDAGHPEVRGEAYFSATDMAADRKGFASRLAHEHYTRPALVPATSAPGGGAPSAPTRLTAEHDRLSWRGDGAAAYAIYRRPGRGPACAAPDGRYLLKVVAGGTRSAVDTTAAPGRTYTYYVAALDRMHRQSTTARGANSLAQGG